jgi:acyl-coenzyme A thioesterase PaaI-like protein
VTATTARRFSDVSAVTRREEGRFSADVDPEWTIRGKPNGGYLLAMLGRASAAETEHDHVIAASAHYLHAPEPGSVSIQVTLLRAGRSASQVRAVMSQKGTPCVESLFTMSRLDPDVNPFWTDGLPRANQVPYEAAVPLVARTPDGGRVAIMDQIEVRLEPDSAAFTKGAPRGRGELRGWLGLPAGEPFDPASLLFAVDAYPPATFDIEFSGWVPTLELTVYVRALPAPGPVRVLQRAQLIDAQRVDEACFVWDSAGRLVAQSTQLAGIRLG